MWFCYRKLKKSIVKFTKTRKLILRVLTYAKPKIKSICMKNGLITQSHDYDLLAVALTSLHEKKLNAIDSILEKF